MPKYFVQNRYLLLFFFFSMLYSWKLALSFNFITYDDVSTSAQAHNPTIYSFIQVFLNTNKFRREKERLLLNWALAFKNIVWFLYWNEMSREERKKSILMCGFFFVLFPLLIYKAVSHTVLIIVEPIFFVAIRIRYRSPVNRMLFCCTV